MKSSDRHYIRAVFHRQNNEFRLTKANIDQKVDEELDEQPFHFLRNEIKKKRHVFITIFAASAHYEHLTNLAFKAEVNLCNSSQVIHF